MKKALLISSIIAFSAVVSCNNANTAYKADVNEFAGYVDSVDKAEPVYTEAQWQIIDDGYQKRLVKVEGVDKMEEDDQKKVAESKVQYTALKGRYEAKITEVKTVDNNRMKIRNQLLGDAYPAMDDQWMFVTPQNIVDVYEKMVDNTRKYGDNYTDAEWAVAKAMWNALNDRKNQVEKDISTRDNLRIAGLKVAYAAIKSVNRPVSAVKEEIREERKENK